VGLDRRLGVVGELVAVRAEELDAVVGVRVVRRRDDGRQVEPVAADEQRRGRGRQHAALQHVAAGGRDARRQRRLQHLAGLAGVADDQHLRALDGRLDRDGTTQPQGEVRSEDLAGDPADAVGSEEPAGQRPA
jgi:hypothetical protein